MRADRRLYVGPWWVAVRGEWRLRPEASMCAPRGGRAKQHGGTDRWEEPKGMSMWNEQANEKVPWANEKVP